MKFNRFLDVVFGGIIIWAIISAWYGSTLLLHDYGLPVGTAASATALATLWAIWFWGFSNSSGRDQGSWWRSE
jgi:hypothetical protein